MTRWKKYLAMVLTVVFVAALVLLQPGDAAAKDKKADGPPTEAEIWAQVSQFKFGDNERPLIAAAGLVAKAAADPIKKKEVEARLAGLLDTATPDAKRFACRQLWIVGTAQSVPALAKLLAGEPLSDAARYGLERMQDPAAGAALREAAGKLKGKPLVGVLDSIGGRRDPQAVAVVAPLLASDDPAVAAAAAWALGRIGTADAATALAAARGKAGERAKRVLDDAYLMAADALAADGKKDAAAAIYQQMYQPGQPRRVRVAALRGMSAVQPEQATPLIVAALRSDDGQLCAMAAALAHQVSGSEATKVLAGELAKLPADAQVMLLAALAARADPCARPAVVEAAASKEAAVKLAAFKALGAVGDAQDVPMLLGAAAAGESREAARASLARLRGTGVDEILLAAAQAGGTPLRVEAIVALAGRRCAAALPAMVKLTAEKDSGLRGAAIDAVGILGGEPELPGLVALAVANPKEVQNIPAAVGNLARKIGDRDKAVAPAIAALAKADEPCKAALVQLLSAVGGDKALAALRPLLKDADAPIAEAALRVLANWEDDKPAADLLEAAKSASVPARQVIALRGYIRMAALVKDRPAAEALAMYGEAMKLARRPDEIKAVLAGLGEVKDPAALALITPCLATDATKAEAAAAALRVARAIQDSHRVQAVAVAKRVLESTKDENLLRQAREIAERK